MPAKHSPAAITPSPRQIRSAIAAALRAARDPKLETPLGWMLLRRQISERQYEAGERFARLAALYARAISAPRRSPRSVDMERIGGWGNGRMEDAAQAAETRGRYEDGAPTPEVGARLRGDRLAMR